MRTTVTIDPDTEHLLREEAIRSAHSFTEVWNQASRHSPSRQAPGRIFRVEPLFEAPFPSDIAALSMNRVAEEWDDEETIKELAR